MGQITKEFAKSIVEASDNVKHFPLTCHEKKQLAVAWLKLHDTPPSSIAASTEPGRIPDLELARTNADYWLGCARHSDENNLGHALIHAEQAINAWKNAAYTMADQRDQFKALSEGLQLAIDRPVSAIAPISVTDRLPTAENEICAIGSEGSWWGIFPWKLDTTGNGAGWLDLFEGTLWSPRDVTHWLPMPEIPSIDPLRRADDTGAKP